MPPPTVFREQLLRVLRVVVNSTGHECGYGVAGLEAREGEN
jgi:hypothetical protein